MRILLAEDEKTLSKVLVKILMKNNYSVDPVYDGEDALYYALNQNYDLIILDIMMPKKDGISVLKEIRQAKNPVPVLLLTAKAEVEDKVLGLDSGADDYLSKPFDTRELLARIRVLTRNKAEVDHKITVGNITLDKMTCEMTSPTASFRLTNKEFKMLEYFMTNPGKILSVDQIIEKVWDFESDTESNTVWVYISYLRKELSALNADITIKASRNIGYYLEKEDDQKA